MNNITIKTKELVDAVAKLNIVAVKESIITVSIVKKKAKDNDRIVYFVTFTAFDGKTQVATNLFAEDAKYDGEHMTFSLGQEFIGVVNAISKAGTDVTVVTENKNAVEVKSGAANVLLNKKTEGIAPVVFDVCTKELIEGVYEMSTVAFKDAVDRVSTGVDSDMSGLYPGMCLSANDNELSVKALNSVVMLEAVCSVLKKQVKENKSIITQSRLLKTVLGSISDDTVRIYKTTAHLLIQSKMQMWQLPLLDNSFPDAAFNKVKEEKRPIRLELKAGILLNAIGVILASGGEQGKKLILKESEGNIIVTNADGSASMAIIPDNMEGELNEICLNTAFLKNSLGVIKTDEVMLEFEDLPLKPVAIKEKDNDKVIVIIAPVKID